MNRGAGKGTPNSIANTQPIKTILAEQVSQPETGVGVAELALFARRSRCDDDGALRSLFSASLMASPLVRRAIAEAKQPDYPELTPSRAPDAPEVATPVRQKQRAADWHSQAYRRGEELRGRYAGQSEQIDQAIADEFARGPDFARFHRGSLFKDPPKNNLDRNFVARLWFVAQMIERKSWACRAKGKHGGTLGTVGMEVLRTLLFVIKKVDGKLYPSFEALAALSRKSKQAVVTAVKVLERMGFITVHKRIKRVQTPLGVRVVQDSNAYEFHLPVKGLGALAMAVFCPRSSESTKSDAIITPYTTTNKSTCGEVEKGFAGKEADRWWLHAPLQTGNGGWR